MQHPSRAVEVEPKVTQLTVLVLLASVPNQSAEVVLQASVDPAAHQPVP